MGQPADAGPPSPRHRTVVGRGGVRLHVVELGGSNRPALVLAHGAGSSSRFIVESFAGPVLACGRRLVTFDLRGHGRSGPVRDPHLHQLDDHAADLRAVVASTAGRVLVVGGVSLGGHAAVRMVAAGDGGCDVALACLPAWTGRAVAGDGPHAAMAAEVREVGVAAVVARLEADPGLPNWLRTTLLRDYRSHDPASLGAVLRSLDGGIAPSTDEIAVLAVPLAVVGWPDDPGHPLDVARHWAATAPTSVARSLQLYDLERGVDRLGEVAMEAIDQALVAPSGARPAAGWGNGWRSR